MTSASGDARRQELKEMMSCLVDELGQQLADKLEDSMVAHLGMLAADLPQMMHTAGGGRRRSRRR